MTTSRRRLGVLIATVLATIGCAGGQANTTSSVEVTGEAWASGPRAPIALTEVAAAAHQGRIWVAGGLNADGGISSAVFVYDPDSNRWEQGPTLPEPIHHAALVSDGDALWLIGGYTGGFDAPTAAVRVLEAGDAKSALRLAAERRPDRAKSVKTPSRRDLDPQGSS